MQINYMNCIVTDITYIFMALCYGGFSAIYPFYVTAIFCCGLNYHIIIKIMDKYMPIPHTISMHVSIFMRIINILTTVAFVGHQLFIWLSIIISNIRL